MNAAVNTPLLSTVHAGSPLVSITKLVIAGDIVQDSLGLNAVPLMVITVPT